MDYLELALWAGLAWAVLDLILLIWALYAPKQERKPPFDST